MVTLAEIRFGIELVDEPTRRAALNDWLTHKVRPIFAHRIIEVTEDIMLKWRILVEEGRKTGHTFSQPDLIIAATALHHGLTVLRATEAIMTKRGCQSSSGTPPKVQATTDKREGASYARRQSRSSDHPLHTRRSFKTRTVVEEYRGRDAGFARSLWAAQRLGRISHQIGALVSLHPEFR